MNAQAPPEAITRAILSGALQKANDAVRADEERDFKYAIEAYIASCELLGQVMGRLDARTDDWNRIDAIVSSRKFVNLDMCMFADFGIEDYVSATCS